MRKGILFLLFFVFLSLLGCSREKSDTNKLNQLVIYTYDSFAGALEESIVSYFAKSRSVQAEIVRFEDTGGLYNQIYLEKENPKADVAIGLDTTYLEEIKSNELFLPYKPANLHLIPGSLLVDPEYRAIPFDYGGITLNYDSKALPDPPKSWNDLLDEKYRGQIVLMNPGTSSPGRNFLLFTIVEFGKQGYLDYWKKLKPNLLTITSGWSEGYGLYTQGEASIVLSYDTSPAYHLHFENESRYKNLFFEGKAFAQIEFAGIINGTKNKKNAEACIDFILTEGFQALIPLNQFMYPVHPDAEVPEAFAEAGKAEVLVSIDGETVSEEFDTWLLEWENVMR